MKKKQEAKEKEHIAEVLKKSAIMSSHDPKFAALVSHYEALVEKKDKHVAALQKQIKEAHFSSLQATKPTADENENSEGEPSSNASQSEKDPNYHTQYQQEIASLKN